MYTSTASLGGQKASRKKMGEAWLAASSHFHFEQMCVRSLGSVPIDSVYLLSFKASRHRRTVMKSGAIILFKAKNILFFLLEKTDG